MGLRRGRGYIGTEIELIILNRDGFVVDAYRKILSYIPKRERGRRHRDIERSRITHDVWDSQPELNIKPFWENQFEGFHKELVKLISDVWEAGRDAGLYVCLLPTPPRGHEDSTLNRFFPRDAETQAIHYHYSKNGGFPDKFSRIPYYNAFVLTYPILMASTLTSFYALGKIRKFLGARFNQATALYPPPYIDPRAEINHEYMLRELNYMRKVIGCIHPVPENIRLFDISFLTKEEAYWLIPRKSTVELRPFDTVPSLLIIQALWLLVAAIGKKVIKYEEEFYKVKKKAFIAIWKLRQRVAKKGFKARLPHVDPNILPKINGVAWPKYLYSEEIQDVGDALIWLINDLSQELDEMGYDSGLAKKVLAKFKHFVKDKETPAERILREVKSRDELAKKLIEICERAANDPFFIP